MMVLLCFLLAEMVTANCPMSGNSSEPYGLNFASLGYRTGLERSSWYVFAKMMLASVPESIFMVCCYLLILMFTIVLGHSFQSFVNFSCNTLFVSFTWGSTDLQTFPKCPFLVQRLQMALRALQRLTCGTFSPQYLQIFIVFRWGTNLYMSLFLSVRQFIRPSIHCATYLKNHTSYSDHNFWYIYVK